MTAGQRAIYLASASPRRSELLPQIGIAHEMRPVELDETPRAGRSRRAMSCASPRPRPARSGTRCRGGAASRARGRHDGGARTAPSSASPPTARGRARDARAALGAHARGAHRGRAGVHAAARKCVSVPVAVQISRALTRAELDGYWRTRRAARQGRRLRHPGPRRDVHYATSRAAIRASWACRSTRPGNCSRRCSGCRTAGRAHEHRDRASTSSPRETRAALLENGVLQELFIERASRRGLTGNLYKGRVSRVLPGMQAAFIDIGLERTAFLHVSDIVQPADAEGGGDRAAHRQHPRAGGRGRRHPGAGAEGPARHQGRAAHDLHHDPVALPRLHALRPRRRRLGAHRERGRAAAAARGRAGLRHSPARRGGYIVRTAAEGARMRGTARRHAVPAAALGRAVRRRRRRRAPGRWSTRTCRCRCA